MPASFDVTVLFGHRRGNRADEISSVLIENKNQTKMREMHIYSERSFVLPEDLIKMKNTI